MQCLKASTSTARSGCSNGVRQRQVPNLKASKTCFAGATTARRPFRSAAPRWRRAAEPSDKDSKGDGKGKKVEEYVEALTKSGLDSKTAQNIIDAWKSAGADADPGELRKLFLKRSLRPLGLILVQLLLDAGAAYGSFVSAQSLLIGNDFFGRGVLAFLANFVGFYFATGVIFDFATLVSVVIASAQLELNSESFLEAVKQVAGPSSGLNIAEKAKATVSSVKVVQALNSIADILKKQPTGPNKSVDTLKSLGAYLALYNAQQKYSFDASKLGIDDAQAGELATLFGQYDTNDDGKLDLIEFQRLASSLSINLSYDEVREAIKFLDTNNDGAVEFEEFVDWYVNKDKGAMLKKAEETEKTKASEAEPAQAANKK